MWRRKSSKGTYIPTYVNKNKAGTTRYMQMGFLKLGSSGSYVYCLEPFKKLNFIDKNIEGWCHAIGFLILMLLMIFITIKDIVNIF